MRAAKLLRANPSKGGDAELRGYSDAIAMPAGPPATRGPFPGWRPVCFQGWELARMADFDFRAMRTTRDQDREQTERDAFLVLYHLYNLCGGETRAAIPIDRICRDQAFNDDLTAALLADLLEWGRLLTKGEATVSITREGLDYIRSAGRRRSARLDAWAPPGPYPHAVSLW